mmetsp:Transcript_4050/g.8137  ORF Transcript_4050/g.8137 Transcript_4050/m.8137 type:complete len:93 (+) Transcript_4050:292-570(+)
MRGLVGSEMLLQTVDTTEAEVQMPLFKNHGNSNSWETKRRRPVKSPETLSGLLTHLHIIRQFHSVSLSFQGKQIIHDVSYRHFLGSTLIRNN